MKQKEIIIHEQKVIESEFLAGLEARALDKLPLANPHKPEESRKYYSWVGGWIHGELLKNDPAYAEGEDEWLTKMESLRITSTPKKGHGRSGAKQ